MFNAKLTVPPPVNEPILPYKPADPETAALKAAIKKLKSEKIEIPLIIGGKEVRTGKLAECRVPHEKDHVLATYHKAGEEEVKMAVEAALEARKEWSEMPWEARASIMLKMAELLAGPWRYISNAATMLGQSKNAYQAEIDSACELIDFYRFNPYFAMKIYEDQPLSSKGVWNYCEYRALEGFVFAVTPFNFSSIAGNLPTSPALMGNVVLWKPASSAVFSAYYLMKLFQEAGLPDGVINFIPGPGSKVGPNVLVNPHLAGVHFTGSTAVFHDMWKTVGENIANYGTYPRIVGETGGKDFIFAHESTDIDELVTAAIRGAFEYQGQKCSAASRMYIPDSLWPAFREKLLAQLATIKMGTVEDFGNFVNAVIDEWAFRDITGYIDYCKNSPDAEIIAGGGYDDSEGYFIQPTVVVAKTPDFKTMVEEIFGPVLTIFVYPANKFEETLQICDNTSTYALTGAIFGRDRNAVNKAIVALRNSAGNFYINDKPTGAVVGQQPFGGARASGTNDKAGSKSNLMRWVSTRTVKETFVPPKDYRYPFLG
ncbi:MAG TPA: L-glutamate gamma-semialdehyde dehydrogenase [candidate division Zixibacteria bacterium]|nr:L-glutamate gamma-semialdehyde dehydrogenase [candidate division Zixibacteria bacterium]